MCSVGKRGRCRPEAEREKTWVRWDARRSGFKIRGKGIWIQGPAPQHAGTPGGAERGHRCCVCEGARGGEMAWEVSATGERKARGRMRRARGQGCTCCADVHKRVDRK